MNDPGLEYVRSVQSAATLQLTKIVNMTQHDCHVHGDGRPPITIHRSDRHLYAEADAVRRTDVAVVHGTATIPLLNPPTYTAVRMAWHDGSRKTVRVRPNKLPRAVLVSDITARALQNVGYDGLIFSPATGPESVVRDDKGRIVGTTALVLHHTY